MRNTDNRRAIGAITMTAILALMALICLVNISGPAMAQANPPFSIAGYVDDGTDPVEGANVSVICLRGGLVQYSIDDTTATGYYEADAGQTILLNAGDVLKVIVTNGTYSGFTLHTITSTEITLGGVDGFINVTIEENPSIPEFTLTVFTMDNAGLPVANVSLSIDTAGGTHIANLTTNASGIAQLPLIAGSYVITANKTGKLNQTRSFDILNQTLNITINMDEVTVNPEEVSVHGLEFSNTCLIVGTIIMAVVLLGVFLLLVAFKGKGKKSKKGLLD